MVIPRTELGFFNSTRPSKGVQDGSTTKPSGLAANHGDSPEMCSPEMDTVKPASQIQMELAVSH